MNRSKLLRLSFGLANSFSSTRTSRLSQLTVTQVTHFSQFTQFNPTSFPTKPFISNNYPFNFHQNVFFSSKPQSFISVLVANDWSEEIENELDKLSPKLTHEFVLYVLMNLDDNPRKSFDFFKWVCDKKGFSPSYWPYFTLLRALACKDFMCEFWDVFSEMIRRGFYIDHRSFSMINIKLASEKLSKDSTEWTRRYKEMVQNDPEKDIVKSVEALISSLDWGEEVVHLLKEKLKFPLTENFLLRVIGELWKTPLKALKFFEWVGSYGGYEHDTVTYNTMAQTLASHESVTEFWDFVKQMRIDGYEVDIYTYMRCTKYLPTVVIVDLYEFMMDGPYQPLPQHTLLLIKKISYEAEPDLDLVYRVFNKFVGAGYTPTKSLYDGVHRTMCNLGMFDEAKKVLEEMRTFGYNPDNFTYSQEIFGLCKIGRLDEACKVIDQMEVEGCVANVKTWTLLIEGLTVANRLDMAISCFQKMKEKSINASPELLLVLVKGYISENKVFDAYRCFTLLVENEGDLKPSPDTFKLLIEKLAEGGNVEAALDILTMMKKYRYPAFPHPITQYISKHGTVEDAKRLLWILAPRVKASITVYKIVIEAFFEQGRYSVAKDLALSSPPNVRESGVIRSMFSLPVEAPKSARP